MKHFILIINLLTISLFLFSQEDDNTMIDSLSLELLNAKEDTNQINLLNQIAAEYIGSDNYKAIAYAKDAQKLAFRLKFNKGNTEAFYNIGKGFFYEYEFDSLSLYYNKSIEAGNLKPFDPIHAKVEYMVGMVAHYQSDYNKAIIHYKKSLLIHELLNSEENKAGCLNNIGAAFYDQGNYEKALENYFLSLEINESMNNKDMVAKSLGNIGGIYEEQGKFDNALTYYNKANRIATEINSKSTIADTYRNIGGIYTEKNKYDSTIIVFNKALTIYKDINDIRGMVVLYNLYGQTYAAEYNENKSKVFDNIKNKNNVFDTIINCYQLSLKLNNQELDEIEEKIVSYNGIGEVYINKKHYNAAIQEFSKALKMAKEIESMNNIKEIHNNLSQAYEGLGQYNRAFDNYKLYNLYGDSLKNDENLELITQNSMQYEFDKQQKEQEFIQAQKDLEYEQKQKQDRLIRMFILAVLVIVIGFSIQVFRGYQRKKKDNELLEEKNTKIEKQSHEITSSIVYAERIQKAIVPNAELADKLLKDYFLLWLPRDIVSGDYWWLSEKDGYVIAAAADCTGHGVPGAFMSMLGVSFLNEIVKQQGITEAGEILNQLRNKVKTTLGQDKDGSTNKDGMDIALLVINYNNMTAQYSGAYNPLFLYRNGELHETKATRNPIGVYIKEKPFDQHHIDLQKGDVLYTFSDGFPDQFGGEKQKKYSTKRFKQLLLNIHTKPMVEQREILNTELVNWRGDQEQIDDVIVLGIKI